MRVPLSYWITEIRNFNTTAPNLLVSFYFKTQEFTSISQMYFVAILAYEVASIF